MVQKMIHIKLLLIYYIIFYSFICDLSPNDIDIHFNYINSRVELIYAQHLNQLYYLIYLIRQLNSFS